MSQACASVRRRFVREGLQLAVVATLQVETTDPPGVRHNLEYLVPAPASSYPVSAIGQTIFMEADVHVQERSENAYTGCSHTTTILREIYTLTLTNHLSKE